MGPSWFVKFMRFVAIAIVIIVLGFSIAEALGLLGIGIMN